jgi:hypothetical protein
MDDTLIYEGMIFKANHNLFEVKLIFFKIIINFYFLVSLYLNNAEYIKNN